MTPLKIMVSAGETSGDNHGAKLIKNLKQEKDLLVYSVGGEKMSSVSDSNVEEIADRAAVGFLEVLKTVPFFVSLKKRLRKKYFLSDSSERVDALVLIDFPGFNINLGKAAAACGVPVFYYITPQVWAWGRKRIPLLSGMCRKLYCVFKFEKKLFRDFGGDAEFVGHPILEDIPDSYDIPGLEKELGVGVTDKVMALMPGSRVQEVKRHLPVMLKVARRTDMIPVVARVKTVPQKIYTKIGGSDLKMTSDARALLKRSFVAVVKSGTSTLEAAVQGVPFVTVYKVSGISFAIARYLVDVPYICMANILAGKEVSPELIQNNLTPLRLRQAVLDVAAGRDKIKQILDEVVLELGEEGASARTALSIIKTLKGESE